MPTILDTLKKGTEYLERYGIEEARLNMEHLIAHVLKVERMQLYLDFDRPLNEAPLDQLRDLTKRRSRGEPLQHLLGTVEFSDLEFAVDRRALIPRPETEELVQMLVDRFTTPPASLLDLGCGSGVIGLSLSAKWGQETATTLADLSEDALALAKENAERLGLADRVQFNQSNLLEGLSGPYGLIAANLPYIPSSEQTELSKEVLQDPPEALYGGREGTELILKLLETAPALLTSGGQIALEFGSGQAETLRIAAEDAGFDGVEIRADLSGTDRFLFAVKTG